MNREALICPSSPTPSLREAKAGTQGGSLKQRAGRKAACWPCRSQPALLRQAWANCPGWHHPQRAGPSHINQQSKIAPTDMSTEHLIEAVPQQRFPFPRRVNWKPRLRLRVLYASHQKNKHCKVQREDGPWTEMEVVGGGGSLTITNVEPRRLHPVLQTCTLIGLCLEVQTVPAEDKCDKSLESRN